MSSAYSAVLDQGDEQLECPRSTFPLEEYYSYKETTFCMQEAYSSLFHYAFGMFLRASQNMRTRNRHEVTSAQYKSLSIFFGEFLF